MITRFQIAALLCVSAVAFEAVKAQTPSVSAQSVALDATALRAGFRTPPAEAKLRCYWWWLNGNTTEATITHDLTEMSHKGFGGVLLVDANGANQNGNANVAPGPTFGSPAWTRLYVHALKTAAALHLEVTLNITSGWNLGGPEVTPDQASKLLTWSQTIVEAGKPSATLPMPPLRNDFYRQIAILAYPLAHGSALAGSSPGNRKAIRQLRIKAASAEMSFSMPPTEPLLLDEPGVAGEQDTTLDQIVDISAQVNAAGQLSWQPPTPGLWEVLRVGYTDSGARVSTSSGAWQGLAIDYLDRAAFDTYWAHTVDPLLAVSKPYLGTTLVSLATDSWELGGTNWTQRFATEFKARRGYDALRYLPVVAGRIVGDRATSNRFLTDLRRTVGDLVTDHYDHFAERAHAFGLGIQCESGGPHGAPFDALETFRSAAVPQTEYWAQSNEHRSTDGDRFFTKEAASAANIYGKPIVAQEGMTSIGPQWSESLATDLKPSFDQGLTEGMNRLVWHEFTSSPPQAGLPGNEYFAGTHLNPNVTWWNQGDAFFQYLNRSQFLLQQGHAVNDVLYFYGDAVPNFARLKKDDPAKVLPGFDYDVTNEDALLRTLVVIDGVIATPAGNRYKLLAMPRGRRLSIASLERIGDFVHQGGRVVGETPLAPTGIVDPAVEQRFATLVTAMWDGCKSPGHTYGKGIVYCGTNGREVLSSLHHAPDFHDASGRLDYIHRVIQRVAGDTDLYFVRNGSNRTFDGIADFRIAGKQPELWNAIDGSIQPQQHYVEQAGTTAVPLHLAPFGSTFVVFERASTPHNAAPPQTTTASTIPLPASTWTLSFQPDRGAPSTPQPVTSFRSWSESSDPGIRYFSGTATYRTEIRFAPAPGERVVLALTNLREICTVRINGKPAGTLWALPYRLDITDTLRSGSNTIELDVTNLWPNRLIGDAQPGVTHPYTHTNIRKYTANSPLLPSGLIGDVTLERMPAAEELHKP
jgi:hypothetical protein